MGYSAKSNEREARERLRAFWARSSLGRPALSVPVANPAVREEKWPGPELTPKQRDLLPEWHAWQHGAWNQPEILLAETMPAHHVAWGSFLTTLACFAGGDYEYHDSAWIQEIPDLWQRPLPRFDPNSPLARTLDACYDAAKTAAAGRGFVTPPLMMDGLSTLAMFRSAERLCMDMVDRPDTVKAWSAALNTLYIDIYEHYYQRLGFRESLCFFGPMAEGRSEGVQCDFAVTLSPAMYEEFVLPDLRRVTDYFDFSLYHLDGTCQMRFIDLLRRCPKLTGIQWNPETTARNPLEWFDAFGEIRRRDFCLMIWASVDEAVAITRELGPDGLFLCLPRFETVAEAETAIRRIEAVC